MAAAGRMLRPHAVLFACGLNAIRSPIAAALFRHLFGSRAYVGSAGVRKGELDPFAVAVMDELGLDLSRHRPMTFEELEEWEGLNFDVIAKYAVLNVREETGRGSLTERQPVLAFGDGVGLMAGVALRGAVLTLNEGLTQAYHGQGQGMARAVMQSKAAPGIETFELWGALSGNLPGVRGESLRTP